LGLPHRVALTDPAERARRQDRLQRAEATFEAMPFDVAAARTYGQIYAAVAARWSSYGARSSCGRLADCRHRRFDRVPLCTRNPDDFRGLENLVTIIAA
jgi:hypothetical protein